MLKTLKYAAPAATAIAVGVLWLTVGTSSQTAMPSTRNGDWVAYTADIRGTRYAPLDQVNASNFSKLEVAWRFKTDNLGTRPEFKLEGTPLAIRGVLYTTAGTRRSVVALDGTTGELIWVYSLDREGRTRAALGAAPVVGPRRRLLDRWQGRRSRPVRDDRLSSHRTECQDRTAMISNRSAKAAWST